MADTTKPESATEAGLQDTSNSCPDKKVLEEAAKIPVQDSEGKEHTFGEIYSWPEESGKKRTVMVIFIRHFFCGVSTGFPFAQKVFGDRYWRYMSIVISH